MAQSLILKFYILTAIVIVRYQPVLCAVSKVQLFELYIITDNYSQISTSAVCYEQGIAIRVYIITDYYS